MKLTVVLACCLCLGWLLPLKSQVVPTDSVPEQISSQFHPLFPDVKSEKWTREGEYYVASFTQHGKSTQAIFDLQGNMLWTLVTVPENQLPQAARRALTEKYGRVNIRSVAKVRSIDGLESYEVLVNNDRISFDPEGKLLSTESSSEPRKRRP